MVAFASAALNQNDVKCQTQISKHAQTQISKIENPKPKSLNMPLPPPPASSSCLLLLPPPPPPT